MRGLVPRIHVLLMVPRRGWPGRTQGSFRLAEQPDISVVLATYNRASLLPRAIASVLAQEGARFELIVVDDASTDGTQEYLATLADPRIRVVRAERNLGPGGVRNPGRD